MKKIILPFLLLLVFNSSAQLIIKFPSKDGIIITADLYFVNDTLPYMILCHQAGFSRGEYKETASKFTKFGYNCIAIDARSGGEVNGIKNETAAAATSAKKAVSYLDAEQDIIAAIDYIYAKSKKKVILVGSSYSASLVLKIATTNDKVKAVLAFSPGEYFGTKLNLKESIKNLNKPFFVTSSQTEAPALAKLIKDAVSARKQQFIPSGKGDHGSKALWKSNPNYHEYWLALLMFMRDIE